MQSSPCPWDEKASFCSSGKNQWVSTPGSHLALETDGEYKTWGRRPAALLCWTPARLWAQVLLHVFLWGSLVS